MLFVQNVIEKLWDKYKYLAIFNLLKYIDNNFINDFENYKSMISYYYQEIIFRFNLFSRSEFNLIHLDLF